MNSTKDSKLRPQTRTDDEPAAEGRDSADRERLERVLDQRAERLARPLEGTSASRRLFQMALVQVGPQRVGVPVDLVREIVNLPPPMRLPQLPPCFLGLVQVRGELMTAVDLARLLGDTTDYETTSLIIVDGPAGPLGLAVGAVLGFRDLHEDELAPDFDATRDGERPFVRAITRDLLTVLDIESLLSDPQIIARQ